MAVVTLWSCVILAAPWAVGFPEDIHNAFLVGSCFSPHLSADLAAQGRKAVI